MEKTKYLVVLAQTLESKWGLDQDTPSVSDIWANAPADDKEYGGKEFSLPDNHKALVVLKSGSFSCENCKFVNAEKHECNNEYFIKWHGNKKLPDAPLHLICSDWFEQVK